MIYIFHFSPSGVVGCTVVDGTIVVGAWVVGRDPALHNLVLQQTVEQDSIAPPLLLLNEEQTRSHRDGRVHPLVKNVWFVFESDACWVKQTKSSWPGKGAGHCSTVCIAMQLCSLNAAQLEQFSGPGGGSVSNKQTKTNLNLHWRRVYIKRNSLGLYCFHRRFSLKIAQNMKTKPRNWAKRHG